MKNTLLFSAALIIFTTLFAQAPQGIIHQVVIRNVDNEPVTNQSVGVRVSVIRYAINGPVVYSETHNPTSNANGLITFVIGHGLDADSFSDIDWADGPYFLKTEADPEGGSNYTIIGTMQFLSVPYALHAGSSSDSQWEQSGNNIFNKNTGNVGIGTLTPEVQLHTTGSVRFEGAGTPGNSRVLISDENGLATWRAPAWNVYESDIYRLNGNVGLGLSTPLYKLDVDGAVASRGSNAFRLRQPTYGAIFRNDNDSFWLLTTDLGDPDGTFNALRPLRVELETGNVRLGNVLNIEHGENVGIGANAPTQKLDINGQIHIRGADPGAGKILTSDANGTASWQASIPKGIQMGEIQYWDGYAWVTSIYGITGQVLTLHNGVPTWFGTGTDVVINHSTGKTWMDRNLGATQVATSSTDADAYGHLYQWGRGNDGHQVRTSGTTTTLSSSDTPGHGNFITVNISPPDWRNPQNDNLWQGVNGTNNPCPSGYRLPTAAEWNAERNSWSTQNAAGAFASPLKLPLGGRRYYYDGSLGLVGSYGYYWSSTVDGIYARYLYFYSSSAVTSYFYRAYGYSVRCLKD